MDLQTQKCEVVMSAYEQNRSKIPFAELQKYDGKWVAFRSDGSRVIASSDDLADLDARIIAAGEDPQTVGLERIEFEPVQIGGAELL